tara:strand:- start:1473 stop:1703 length:231 start_codon:yes stop_codon:yes gene_type:complete
MIIQSVKNAVNVNSKVFISYAGMALPFVKYSEYLVEEGSIRYCKSLDYIKSLLEKNDIDSNILLDMIPGGSYNFIE